MAKSTEKSEIPGGRAGGNEDIFGFPATPETTRVYVEYLRQLT